MFILDCHLVCLDERNLQNIVDEYQKSLGVGVYNLYILLLYFLVQVFTFQQPMQNLR